VRPISTVLCDDVAEIRALVRWELEGDARFAIVGEVGDGPAVLELVQRISVDLLVIDLMMPGLEPSELLRVLSETAPRATIVTFSGSDPRDVAPAMVGAVALHVPKTTELAVMRQALIEVAADRPPGVTSLTPGRAAM
jgi:DNA-binding NarL/FixJ family response regulator